jgi:O-acetyl-ADP-ribose deacetylase
MLDTASEGVQISNSVVRLIKGDITDLEVDAFVFYAQPDLALGTGFGTAISLRGGQGVQKELDELAPLGACEAVVSGAGNLKAEHIIHAVGPRFQEEDTEEKLRTTMVNSLKCAEEKGIQRIAFPAMGAGYYGIPSDVCARIMLDVIAGHLKGETGIKELVICVLDTPQYESFEAPLAALV